MTSYFGSSSLPSWKEIIDEAATYSFLPETIRDYLFFDVMISSDIFYIYMTRKNTKIKFAFIPDNYFNNCICNCFKVIQNQLKMMPKQLKGINPLFLSVTLDKA